MSNRYKKTSKDTIIDTVTGLEWQADFSEKMSQGEGKDYAEGLDLGGYSDWRMPTIEELITLIGFSRRLPTSLFPGMPGDGFWSSSVYAYDTSRAWYVNFDIGYVNFKYDEDYTNHVRCVRRGPLKFQHFNASEQAKKAEARVVELETENKQL